MNSRDLTIGIMFLSQTAVGILGNFFFLFYCLGLYFKKSALKPTEFIITNLIAANFLIIVFRGIPKTISAFGLKEFLNDVGCNLLLYVQRVGRNMSVVTTCFLSIFQVITISSRNSCWKYLKIKIQRHISLSIILCWIMHVEINFIFPVLSYINSKSKNITRKRYFDHCSIPGPDKLIDSLYIALFNFPEVLFTGLIVWSTSYMIVILYRHKQQVQHIHSTHYHPRLSPETRATQSILGLVSTFVSFYTISSLFNVYIVLSIDPNWWLMNIASFLSMSFSAWAPFVLMSHKATVLSHCFAQIRNKKSPDIITTV